MLLRVILLIYTAAFAYAVVQCPKNTLSFDLERCDPRRRSQCPSGFTCRRGEDTERPTADVFLCCETASMSIGEWFVESLLTPQIFPQVPVAGLKSIEMLPLDASTAFPIVHTGDEVVLLTFPNYATAVIRNVEFMAPPPAGGFLHIMTIIDPSMKPFAVFLTYNLPSTGYIRLPVPDMLQGMSGRASYFDNSTALVKQDSYRAQYVVLVYRTNNPISIGIPSQPSIPGQISAGLDLMNGCTDVQCLMGSTTLGKELGQPLAGSIFHVTTKRTMFQTVEITTDHLTQATATIFGQLLILFVTYLFV
ncbi:hypothetical protein Y032_0021g393 [Ancylostoma ceylanicum]|uniref:Uncharacterized protein n=1 Tax=Ancylostoma ceylanicum TaxID=53326 RepID=A0A016UZ79_9BILA|nr:hypothetical protein Y032_0021g393 [Ancylostoma ceylanicum]